MAHRGASEYTLENSCDAFERAALVGADLLEVDVLNTSDGVMDAWHDPTVQKLGGEPHPVSALTKPFILVALILAGSVNW